MRTTQGAWCALMMLAIVLLRQWMLRRRMDAWQDEWERRSPSWAGYPGRY